MIYLVETKYSVGRSSNPRIRFKPRKMLASQFFFDTKYRTDLDMASHTLEIDVDRC